jgi:hypothetical protein
MSVTVEQVYQALRQFPDGARVAEIVGRCYDDEALETRYQRCHLKIWEKLCKLEKRGRAERIGEANYIQERYDSAPQLWRAL